MNILLEEKELRIIIYTFKQTYKKLKRIKNRKKIKHKK